MGQWIRIEIAPRDKYYWLSDGQYVVQGFFDDDSHSDEFLDGFWTDGSIKDAWEGSGGIYTNYEPLSPQPQFFMMIKKPHPPKVE